MGRITRRKKLFEIVVDEIKVFIESDGLLPGDKLPTERELMEILNVSRTSLREALMVLQNSGFLEIIQGKGIFLKRKTEIATIDHIHDGLDGEKYLDHLHEARSVIECQLAMLAAGRATEKDMALLNESLIHMENDLNRSHLSLRIQADYEFHYRIADCAKNPILKEVLKQIDEKLYAGRSVTLSFPKGREKAIKAHRRIFEAISQKDAIKAKEEMQKHIEEVHTAQKQMHVLKEKEKDKEGN